MEKKSHPLRNIKLTLEFDGTDYMGWQFQAKGATVQSVLEDAVQRILGKRAPIVASGRTDSGVHVLAQVASVRGHFPLDDKGLQRALNAMLPPQIAVTKAETMPPNFHALKDAKWKKYRYVVYNSEVKSPMLHRTSWHIIAPLKISDMRRAAAALVGKKDFASFMGSNSSVKTSIRNIISLDVKKRGKMVFIEVTANGFLRQMVRNIAGTLVEMGRGRIRPEAMKEILDAKDRRKAGPTAPPQGLFLVEVGY
ncbi:MAG: tRNA pseudouridine(38-40) synthase TruA [Nitrospinae bacterium]|nr:tRNA pseudouridine(38-40) synthase TruA [Nitrospinota bacterium]